MGNLFKEFEKSFSSQKCFVLLSELRAN